MKKLKPIMFVGTASDVGKSIISTGFCRILKQDGFTPAPFKAQNMSLNSYVTPQGFEIGRAQAVQAEACGIACHTDMNPVLLKPTGEQNTQVVLHGKPVGNQSAYDYFMGNNKQQLFKEAREALDRLMKKHNPVVLEGAGSISELNLKHRDITNMRMALYAGADVYLVADIDRGGVFASIYGTIALLAPEEKHLIKGIIINKFRGDARLFESGKKTIEDLCGIPVTGVVPFRKDLYIDAEDSVALQHKQTRAADGKINVAVILLNRLSNFTDFAVLENDARVHLFYTNTPAEIEQADVIIIPGSKNTIADLIELKNKGAAQAIVRTYRNNKTVIGICGGYQMMGQCVEDPLRVEGDIEMIPGLGILPVSTTLTQDKTTRQCTFRYKKNNVLCKGYEIHMGHTRALDKTSPLNITEEGAEDGFWLTDRCWGTYMHGILDNAAVINDLISLHTGNPETAALDYSTFREKQYDLLAGHLREHLQLDAMYNNLSA